MPVVEAVETEDASSSIVDVQLFKSIGLYRILGPVQDNQHASKYRRVLITCVCVMLSVSATQLGAMYFMLKDFERMAQIFMAVTISLTSCTKGYVLARQADRLWRILEMARYGFTLSGRRNPSELNRSRAMISSLGKTYALFSLYVFVVWMMSPFFIREPLRVIHRDGTVAELRVSVQNLWTPLPDAVYNSMPYWIIIYSIESFIGMFNVLVFVMFDCYMMTVCLVFNAQFRSVTAAYQSLGNRLHRDDSITTGHYDELICYIKDNQRIIRFKTMVFHGAHNRKYVEFFNVVQPVVLIHIALSSTSGILFIFFASLMYMTRYPLLSMPVMKFFSGFISLTMHVFFYCYAYTYIESAKAGLNFGLYSSNWTEMDLKFKKTVLLAMRINSCHNRIMRMSPLSPINLEMFTRVMKFSYTIVSVLLNTNVE